VSSIDIEMDAEVSFGESLRSCPGIGGVWYRWERWFFIGSGTYDVALHGISVDLNVAMNVGDERG
jgi:hypothetical protein